MRIVLSAPRFCQCLFVVTFVSFVTNLSRAKDATGIIDRNLESAEVLVVSVVDFA